MNMAHIALPEPLPGIRGLMAFRPETAKPLNALAEVLLRSDEGLSKGERELIATFISYLNDCFFCQNIHGAVAQYYYSDSEVVQLIKNDYLSAPVSDKMKALLTIAKSVQQGGKQVTEQQVIAARGFGATDIDIHDTVLIAAAFCMFNRYVDGLGTFAPSDPTLYQQRAKRIAEETGYLHSMPQ